MTTMSDRDVIAWARDMAEALSPSNADSTIFARLADLAEKGAEDWQDATTAHPKDDRDVLLCGGNGPTRIGYFSHIGYTWCDKSGREDRPTHWRPLPAPPGGER